jgi:hypothetical protein
LNGVPQATSGSVTYAVEANDANIKYSPSGSWTNVKADGSFDSRAMFLVSNRAEGAINYTFSRKFSFEIVSRLISNPLPPFHRTRVR